MLDRLAALRRPAAREFCLAVRDLVVVCSSSRGGSSLFGELLRRHPGLVGFSAEINPHVVIAGLELAADATAAVPGSCDLLADPRPIADSRKDLEVLQAELGRDLGRPASGSVVDRGELSDRIAWRLTMQWPDEPIDPEAVAEWVDDCLNLTGGHLRDRFLADLLERARRRHPSINPRRYDLGAAVLERFPDAPEPLGPTAEPVVEMAPFVAPRAWSVADSSELATAPVLAVTPRNAFRLPLLQAAFPNARMRVVHLTRNPAAAVNGLYDGWLHHGFFSCRTDEPLSMAGYEGGPWVSRWWSYDLPPGWRGWTDRPLVEVCAFQWRAAHRATINTVADMGLDCHRIAFEDVVGAPERSARALGSLASWLGVDPAPLLAGSGDLPVVMSTAPPGPGRWRSRRRLLAAVLRDRSNLDLAAQLGYGGDPSDWP